MDDHLRELLKRTDHLSDEFSEVRDGIRDAVSIAHLAPAMALVRARVLEYVIRDVFERRVNEPPGTRPLENLIQRLVKDGHLPSHSKPLPRRSGSSATPGLIASGSS